MKKKYILLLILMVMLVGCNKEVSTNTNELDDNKEQVFSLVNYEVKETSNPGESELYINGKKFDELDWNYYAADFIYNIGDLLLVNVCTSSCDGYLVNGNGKIVGIIGTSNLYQINIKTLLETYKVEKVEDNDLYISSYNFTYQDGSSVCQYNDNDVVKVTQKFTYLGDNKFSEGITTESLTKKDLLEKDSRFVCEVKTGTEQESRPVQDEIKYEIKNTNGKGELYINDKLFDAFEGISYSSDRIYKFKDLLLVGVCQAFCEHYFVNKDGEVIGNFLGSKMMAGGIDNFIKPKYSSYWIEKVEGNDLYVTSYKYSYQDGSSVCIYKFDEEVKVTEKFTYLGNNMFSIGTVVESLTKQDVLNQDKRIKCSTVDVDAGGRTITLDFDGLEQKLIKKVDNYEVDIKFVVKSSCTEAETTKSVSMNSITKVLNKLKSAKKITYLPTSKECTLYKYSVGNDLVIFESDDQKSILAGIEGEGFAFDYDSSVKEFFESLY